MKLLVRHRCVDQSDFPLIMGILNVTPDSFSDGGEFSSPQSAIDRAMTMIAEGADIIDLGPESTRPGSAPVPGDEQIARSVPVIQAIRAQDDQITISIDTRMASVAKAALDAGADMVNDVSALSDDPEMIDVVLKAKASIVLMHMRGTPADMQAEGGPHYDDVVDDVATFLDERRTCALNHGVPTSRIILDPGIGFGKRIEHNLLILRNLDRFVALGQPLLIGASRKSFIGRILGIPDPRQRLFGSLAAATLAALAGVAIVRAHDVGATAQAVRILAAVRQAGSPTEKPTTRE